MANQVTMTQEQAERELGPRGSLKVTAANRHIVRKWLTSQGFPSQFCAGLSLVELGTAYNALDGHGIEAVRRKLEKAASEDGAPDGADDTFEAAGGEAARPSAVQAGTPAMPSSAGTPDAARIAAVVAAALASMPQPGVDESKVKELVARHSMTEKAIRDLIASEVPNHVATVRVEVKTPKEIIKGEGPRHKQFAELLAVLAEGIPVLMVGPAGSGKTTAAEQCAEALGQQFGLQGAVTGAHELLGYNDAHGKYQTTTFRAGFEQGWVTCLDELDASDPAAPLVANAAIANGVMPFPDSPLPLKRHESFRLIATANTFGTGADRVYVGRNQLDAATLDRFYFLHWEYDEKLERMVAGNDTWTDRVQSLRHSAGKQKARVVISPRASIMGAKLLAAGMNQTKVENALIWKGMDSELRNRIEQGAR